MSIKIDFYQLFKRRTMSTSFIPEIDGLRFLAIIIVIVCHVHALYLDRVAYGFQSIEGGGFLRALLQQNGENGVMLFFTISGFILMLPFARHFLEGGREVVLKKYYVRRLTRLEPPYILVLLSLFILKIFIQGKSFTELWPHLWASIFYVHSAIYQEMSWITPITWSLEIEIQFYILAPMLAAIFRMPKAMRRSVMITAVFLSPCIQHWFGISKLSFLGTMQYFFVGFILVDLYVCKDRLHFSDGIVKLGGAALFMSLLLIDHAQFSGSLVYPALICASYYLVFNTDFWRDIFKNKVLTSIGGMCYSLYLLHFAAISFFGSKTFLLKVSDYFLVNVAFQLLILLPAVVTVSSVYYLLIEKPCMDPKWPSKLFTLLKSLTVNENARSLAGKTWKNSHIPGPNNDGQC